MPAHLLFQQPLVHRDPVLLARQICRCQLQAPPRGAQLARQPLHLQIKPRLCVLLVASCVFAKVVRGAQLASQPLHLQLKPRLGVCRCCIVMSCQRTLQAVYTCAADRQRIHAQPDTRTHPPWLLPAAH